MAGMLIGHGAFGLVMGKATLLRFYDAVGLGVLGLPLPTLRAAIGGFQMVLGVLCVQATRPVFFVFVCTWKLGTEFLHVPAQAYGAWWEVLERASSYAAPPVVDRVSAGARRARGHRPRADPPSLGARARPRGPARGRAPPLITAATALDGCSARHVPWTDRPTVTLWCDGDRAGPLWLHCRGPCLGGH
jgi:hypothetical protein